MILVIKSTGSYCENFNDEIMINSLKIRNYVINLSLVILSIFLSILIAEGICRSIFDPVDYLRPELIKDDMLGHKIKPNSGHHDSWGYRNNSVPVNADIVAIGDSQTYGVSATAYNSWPSVLQRITGKNVYNLSLGGYGPVEYYYLLKNEALKLNPSIVIVGFYYGNDLLDTYHSVYRNNSHWEYLRNPNFAIEQSASNSETNSVAETHVAFQSIRVWLGRRSILYKIVGYSLSDIVYRLELKVFNQSKKNYIAIEDKNHNIYAGFTPRRRLRALDLNDHKVREGLRLSLELFSKMNDLCRKKNIHFIVVLIPTKESVFSEYIENNSAMKNSKTINELITNERQVNEIVQINFEEHNIGYIDVITPLKNAVGKEQIYPSNHDGHPNKNGYKIISTSIQQYLGL